MSTTSTANSFGALARLPVGSGSVAYFSLEKLERDGIAEVGRLPVSIRILLEAVLRSEDGRSITRDDIAALAGYQPSSPEAVDIPFKPARVLLQDFTGVPCIVDLAAMRSAMQRLGGDPKKINPRIPVDLVVDHSVQVDRFASKEAFRQNAELEFQRNRERYQFLAWGQKAFRNFRVVPPASGICHQVNLEYLGRVVRHRKMNGNILVYPDTLVGTDSHTPMINGLGVVGWGVGGIEAEAVMLGQPLYMLAPPVVGFRLTGSLPEGATATDLVLTITEFLRRAGVVGKFVEFFGPGLSSMTVPDRATIANMSPECGSTINFFPVDGQTLEYLKGTGRSPQLVALVEAYCKGQGLFRTDDTPDPEFAERLELDLSTVVPSLAGPKRPHDRIPLSEMRDRWNQALSAPQDRLGFALDDEARTRKAVVALPGGESTLTHGSVLIAAITSCTNTSNPSVLIAAGLLAKRAVEAGLSVKPWVKTSFAPGSPVVTDYLDAAGLTPFLERLGFHLVGYGCTTCIGNSGPLPEPVAAAVVENQLVGAAVLSGNRNFEGRIHPLIKAAYLASPVLVVAYALAGTVNVDFKDDSLGMSSDGSPVYLEDIWPTAREVAGYLHMAFDPEKFRRQYGGIENSNEAWNRIPIKGGELYEWDEESAYIREPPFFTDMTGTAEPVRPVESARVLVMVGDSVTTDHISPAGTIPADGPAGRYLVSCGVEPADFNSFGSRRGNDQVMTRGTFANIRLRNRLAGGREGGWTTHLPSGELTSIFDAASRYREAGTDTIVLAGRDYGMGSSRDWAAKGTALLGVRAVIACSFERIHRSNLVGMGILPLQFKQGDSADSLGLTGTEHYSIPIPADLSPRADLVVRAAGADGQARSFTVTCRLDTPVDVAYYRNGGILQTVLRGFLKE